MITRVTAHFIGWLWGLADLKVPPRTLASSGQEAKPGQARAKPELPLGPSSLGQCCLYPGCLRRRLGSNGTSVNTSKQRILRWAETGSDDHPCQCLQSQFWTSKHFSFSEEWLFLWQHMSLLLFSAVFFLNHTSFFSKMYLPNIFLLGSWSNSNQMLYYQNRFNIWTKFQTRSSVLCFCVLKIVCNTGLHQSNAQIQGKKKEDRVTRSSHKPAREAERGYRWNFPYLISLWHHLQWQTFIAAARQSGVSNILQGDTQGLHPKKKKRWWWGGGINRTYIIKVGWAEQFPC